MLADNTFGSGYRVVTGDTGRTSNGNPVYETRVYNPQGQLIDSQTNILVRGSQTSMSDLRAEHGQMVRRYRQ